MFSKRCPNRDWKPFYETLQSRRSDLSRESSSHKLRKNFRLPVSWPNLMFDSRRQPKCDTRRSVCGGENNNGAQCDCKQKNVSSQRSKHVGRPVVEGSGFQARPRIHATAAWSGGRQLQTGGGRRWEVGKVGLDWVVSRVVGRAIKPWMVLDHLQVKSGNYNVGGNFVDDRRHRYDERVLGVGARHRLIDTRNRAGYELLLRCALHGSFWRNSGENN